MSSPRQGSPRRGGLSALAAVAVLGLLPATGCQVEYAGMTLPSGKYMRDDVQYFAPGPDFPYANTQAATQRARMAANGMNVPPPPAAGAAFPVANPNALGNPANNFNVVPLPPVGGGGGGAPGAIPIAPNPGATVPAVPNPNPVAPPAGAVPTGAPVPPPPM